MAINLDRAEKIGASKPSKVEPEQEPFTGPPFGQIKILNINKVPYDSISTRRKGHYQCPYCKNFTLRQIIDYRCNKCESRVIAWKCYRTDKEEKHELYDSYISRFYEATEAKMKMLKDKHKKEGKKWPGENTDDSNNRHPN